MHYIEHPVDTCTSVTSAEVTIPAVHAPTKGACIRPLPWTLLQPFMLEWELSNHPDKAFVRQLIDNLQHGCNIGYNLLTQQTTWLPHHGSRKLLTQHFKKSVKQVEFSAHSSHLLCQTFVHQAGVLSQNTMEVGELYTTFRHLHHTVSMIT